MRIDAHQHFWEYRPDEYGWIDERMEVLRRDFTPGDLKPLLQKHGFDGSVAVQACQHLGETEYLLRLADENEIVRGVVGWVDLRAADVAEQLDRFRSHPRFVGVRHVVQDEADEDWIVRDETLRGLEVLEKHRVPYDLLFYHFAGRIPPR